MDTSIAGKGGLSSIPFRQLLLLFPSETQRKFFSQMLLLVSNRALMLWLEQVDPEVLSEIPSLRHMAANGVDIRLTPQPIIEMRSCYYQTLTGMGSGKTGYFDAVKPVAYQAHLEEGIPDG